MTNLVQHKFNETNAVQNTVQVTVSSTGANNPIIVGIANNGTMTVTQVTDNKAGGSNVYVQAVGAQFNGLATDLGDCWYCLAPGGGVTQVTIQFSASDTSFKDGWVWEVGGFSGAVFDKAAVLNGQTGAGTADNGAAVVTSGADGFVVGIIVTGGSIAAGGNPASGNEFTAGGDIQTNTGNAACSLVSTSAASHQPNWTDNNTNQTYGSGTVAFKAGSKGPIGGFVAPVLLW